MHPPIRDWALTMKFSLQTFDVADVVLIRSKKIEDSRGYFMETWSEGEFERLGISARFIQDNQSLSKPSGTLRGLHFQHMPFAQAKLIRVVRGAIFDVAVDLRRASPTFGRWCGTTLTSDGGDQLFIPGGFAHGFVTLQPDVVVCYRVDSLYVPQAEGGIRWDDPELAIVWPFEKARLVLSDRDSKLPSFRDYREVVEGRERSLT